MTDRNPGSSADGVFSSGEGMRMLDASRGESCSILGELPWIAENGDLMLGSTFMFHYFAFGKARPRKHVFAHLRPFVIPSVFVQSTQTGVWDLDFHQEMCDGIAFSVRVFH